jgi:HAD superfamily hydrolase (TIGR01549 family)
VELEAVTIDAYGTLVTLRDPMPELRAALASRGIQHSSEDVQRAFEAEVAFYVARSHEGRDEGTLALLRRDCARVFLEALEAKLDADDFTPVFVSALTFAELPGARDACLELAAAGLRLAVVSNWDVGLHDHLAALGLNAVVDIVVTSAEAGPPKPAPAVFEVALARLGVGDAARVVHIGDAAADEEGAKAAGLRFEPAPIADAVQRILA